MTDQNNDPKPRQAGPVIEALQAEIISLREQNEQLTWQTKSLAEANARAAEMMVNTERGPHDPNNEGQTREPAEQARRDLHTTTDGQREQQTAELLSCNKQLQRQIAEYTKAEQDQAQLLAKLESVNKELKDFAYIISHDLKAPLRGIKTLASWIATDYGDKLDDEGKEQLDLLLRRVDRMADLINGVLQYSRVSRVREDMVEVDLGDLLPNVIDMLAPPDGIQIAVQGELPVITCERTRITQVFQNLLGNALKYMDKPDGRITVTCAEDDGFWKFSVADNGPGIDEKHFERIFKIFQTLAPKDETESTGVGLTLVKKIVELYGGKVWVESEIGKGSTFYFTLPTAREPEPAGEDAVTRASEDVSTAGRQATTGMGDHLGHGDPT